MNEEKETKKKTATKKTTSKKASTKKSATKKDANKVVTKKTAPKKEVNETKKTTPVAAEVKEEKVVEQKVETSAPVQEEKKPKSLGSIVLGIILLIVLIGTFVLTKVLAPTYFTEINFKKYEKVVETANSIIYVGSNEEEIKVLTEIAKERKLDINYLNSEKLTEEQKQTVFAGDGRTSKLMITVNNSASVYVGEYDKTDLLAALADKGIISKGIQQVTVTEYLEIIKKSGFHFMFIGSESCSWCVKFKPELESVVEKYKINAYYVDLASASEEDYYALIASNSYFSENNWGTPTSFIYKDGTSLTTISGYVDEETLVSELKEYKVID